MTIRRTPVPCPPLPPGRPSLVLTGFMATGKTEVGSLTARLLGLPFFDLDQVVEARTGRSVAELFGSLGERGFRLLEAEALADAAALSGAVIATGGGAVLQPGWPRLAEGASMFVLTADPEEILRRASSGPARPLLNGDPPERLRALLEARSGAYERAGDQVDTTSRSADQVAAELARRYGERPQGGARIDVEGPNGRYPVVIGPGATDLLGPELTSLAPSVGTAVVVADPAIEHVARRAVGSLAGAGIATLACPGIPSGERAKSAGVLQGLWRDLAAASLDRTGVVVAVGGGATLDVAGFAAATFGRGVPLVNVPTTLLGMVDASLGGKTGIDHSGVKNLVGAFHHPTLVVADPNALESLPDRDLRAGLAEVVKAFVLASPLGLEAIPRLRPRHPSDLAWLVEQAVRIKAAFVGGDPGDRGARQALNLGHTFAHALESATGFELRHGEAVAIGLVAAARLGASLGSARPDLPVRLAGLLSRVGLPTEPPPGIDPDAVVAAMGADKKRRRGEPVFVVPAQDGVELVEGLDPRAALDSLFDPAREPV